MKILVAITKSNFGGAQKYVFDVATGAAKAGHDVVVLAGKEGPLSKKLEMEGVRFISLPSLWRDVSLLGDFNAFADIITVLRCERPDVIHLNSSKMGLLGALAARLMGTPCIIFTAHGWPFNEMRPWWQKIFFKKLMWWVMILSHKTICVSGRIKQDVRQWPFIERKLAVIHNGIAPFPLEPHSHEPDLVVGTLSELHHTKGLDLALKGFAEALKGTTAHFVIMGDGEEKPRLEDLAMSLGIIRQVHFEGFVPDAQSKLSHFDIFTLTSRTEGLPYGLLEAGIASLPVIAARVGGIPEVISDGVSGILFKKDNVSEFAQALVLLSHDRDLRTRLGAELYNTVLKNFALDDMLNKTFSLYRR